MFSFELLCHGELFLLFCHVSCLHHITCELLGLPLFAFSFGAHFVGHPHLEQGFLSTFVGDVHLLIGYIFHLLANSFHYKRITVTLLVL